jgi:hypothetical protein
MFVLIIMFSIFPVLYLYMQPTPSPPEPKVNSDPVLTPAASETKPPDAADAAQHAKPEPPASGPGLLSLVLCVLSAAAVLISKQP